MKNMKPVLIVDNNLNAKHYFNTLLHANRKPACV